MYLTESELKFSEEFINNGFIISEISEMNSLNYISNFFINAIKKYSNKISCDHDIQSFLNKIHNQISIDQLNDFRLNLIDLMARDEKFRMHYYLISKNLLNIIVGNELVMQNRVNLSIQFPNDDSSLLPIHADTWSGDSPFEVVVWLPLVDCYDTKSMYILPPNKMNLVENLKSSKEQNKDLYDLVQKYVHWVKINYGQVMIFNQSLPHGNIVNQTYETRWSMNCRFKSLFSPYGDKGIGEFFEPITTKPITKIGLKYKYPF